MKSLEDKIISAVLRWNDSKETDSPEEVSVLRHHVRTALEAEAMQPPTQRAQPAAESFIGQAEQADFEDDTWTFKMQHPYIVGAGFYRISYVGLTTPAPAA